MRNFFPASATWFSSDVKNLDENLADLMVNWWAPSLVGGNRESDLAGCCAGAVLVCFACVEFAIVVAIGNAAATIAIPMIAVVVLMNLMVRKVLISLAL